MFFALHRKGSSPLHGSPVLSGNVAPLSLPKAALVRDTIDSRQAAVGTIAPSRRTTAVQWCIMRETTMKR
jgi:hypothetical protein